MQLSLSAAIPIWVLCEAGDKQSALIRAANKVESVVREPCAVSLFGQRHSLRGTEQNRTEETEGRIDVRFKFVSDC